MHTMDLDVGVPSRGWHGEAYRGHIFWDELFIFPFLNFRLPEITRSLLMYRYRRLDEARRAARQEGFEGAMFPWQSGSSGRDEGPSRIHLDLHVEDPDAAADRAVLLGAAVVVRHELGYVVLTSPAGITFCFVTHPAAVRPAPASWPGGRSVVDQICLDVPPSAYDLECDFWAAVLDWELSDARLPQFRRLRGPGTMALRFLLQRLDSEDPAGAHVDLGADPRAAEVARHQGLGAELVSDHDVWTVLRDPAGSRYCVTERDLSD